ncbi:hypothetical protein C7H19_11560 [Aphanothece hegewaldii CCALA 016]|uniref:Uncharacterized protein n=1 Tax=Aphanothece hegewaldii CCALA 016 TaxID=2107694 RepID=A0A2T1LXH9_9CHRO|nr:hypothetical protein C7H19_11560 [Aphanothece hegewaldii CCALA 016]
MSIPKIKSFNSFKSVSVAVDIKANSYSLGLKSLIGYSYYDLDFGNLGIFFNHSKVTGTFLHQERLHPKALKDKVNQNIKLI